MIVVSSCVFNFTVLGIFLVFIIVLYLNCLCASLAYGLPELNKFTYLLSYLQTDGADHCTLAARTRMNTIQ